MAAPPLHVFVYGTLKRGGSNHHYLHDQKFLSEARSVPGYTLYQPADYPGLVIDPADQDGVTGEVWEISPACLSALDELEGVKEGLYRRIAIPLAEPHSAMAVETYLYLLPVIGHRHLGSTWRSTGHA